MLWENTIFFTTSDLLAREAELLDGVQFVNRHDIVKHIIEERIKSRLSHIVEPLDEISEPAVFKESALCLNLAIVLRENSTRKDDIFAVRAEFYQRRFEEEIERAFASIKLETEESGIEIVR